MLLKSLLAMVMQGYGNNQASLRIHRTSRRVFLFPSFGRAALYILAGLLCGVSMLSEAKILCFAILCKGIGSNIDLSRGKAESPGP